MSVINQWLLLLVALASLAYLVIKGKGLSNKQFLAGLSFAFIIFFFIGRKGTIDVHKSINTFINITMWVVMIGLSVYSVILKDAKRLAMVLILPASIIAMRLIDIIFAYLKIQ